MGRKNKPGLVSSSKSSKTRQEKMTRNGKWWWSLRFGSRYKGYWYLDFCFKKFRNNPILRPFSSRVIFFPVVSLFWNQRVRRTNIPLSPRKANITRCHCTTVVKGCLGDSLALALRTEFLKREVTRFVPHSKKNQFNPIYSISSHLLKQIFAWGFS